MHPFTKRKEELKVLAHQIREAKAGEREASRRAAYAGHASAHLHETPIPDPRRLGFSFRVAHIAYCEARGRTRAQIEPKVRKSNVLSPYWERCIEDDKWDLISAALAYTKDRAAALEAS